MRQNTSTLHNRGSVMACQEYDLSFRRDSSYLVGDFDPIHARHIDVEKNKLWLQFDHFLDGFFTVFGLAADFE